MADGSSFEILTQEVFQAMLDQSPIKGVKVEHNVIVVGKDGPHQIDNYFEFENAGIIYRNIISDKDWKSRVKKGHIHEFKDILADIPGQPRGIVVTRTGFQSGARTVATRNGIQLYQLEEVTHDGPINLNLTTLGYARMEMRKTPLYVLGAGRVGYSYISIGATFEPEFEGSRFDADLVWMSKQYGLAQDEAALWAVKIKIHAAPHEVKLLDQGGTEISTLARVYRGFVDEAMKSEGTPHTLTHHFETATFLPTPEAEIPLIKINSISSTVTVTQQQYVERACQLPNMALCVLRNLDNGSVRLIGKKVSTASSTESAAAAGSAA